MEAVMLMIVISVVLGAHTEANMCTSEDYQANYDDGIIRETVRYGHYVELKCCTHDATEVTWYKWNNSTDTWLTLDPDVDDVIFHHHNQIIAINSVDFDDKGFYKCSRGSQSIDNLYFDRQFQLDVIPCDGLARGPFPIAPLPCSETRTKVGSILTLPCTGYFGCGSKEAMRVVTWLVSPLGKENAWQPVATVDGERYTTKEFNREGYSIKGSNLTIRRVSSVDFQRKFMCVLATPQLVNGESKIVVNLKHDDGVALDTASISPMPFVVLVSVASVLILTAIVILFVTLYKFVSMQRREQAVKSSELNLLSTKTKHEHSAEFSV